jgi:beta-hydroxylase
MTWQERHARIIKDVGSKMLWSFESKIARRSLVGDRAMHDAGSFPWLALLEARARAMRDELDAILEHRALLPALHEISPDQRSITSDDRWKAFFLYGFGERSEDNCVRCPITARAIEQVPGLVTAFFSILSPGKHIPRHRGVYKGLLRVHLALKVPPNASRCRMDLDGTTIVWREGHAFVFDDTYPHEVWNECDEERVVLILDFYRPLPRALATLNRALVRAVAASPFVTIAAANERDWERRFAEALRRENGGLAVA